MIRLLLAVSIAISDYLRRYMPTNKIRDRVYAREGLKWGIPAMLLAIPFFGIALWLARIIENGAPGGLNVAVLICLWSGFKMLWLGPISVVRLIRARIRERTRRHRRCVGEMEINPSNGTAGTTMGTSL
ncbi:sulfate permease [Schaalia sp. JY-X159]|uniref:sulfate permease n=1 Tax=Schaalia sp. JY-X159 TaxID=2758575 RepID=UPI00165E10EA|nr:sulfate permease [Schaalia sp. JY-X159]